jgi:hypothetical protein
MIDRDDLTDPHSAAVAVQEAQEGFYWVVLGQSPPEIAYWVSGEWWLAGEAKPWHPKAVTVASDRLAFTPRMVALP